MNTVLCYGTIGDTEDILQMLEYKLSFTVKMSVSKKKIMVLKACIMISPCNIVNDKM